MLLSKISDVMKNYLSYRDKLQLIVDKLPETLIKRSNPSATEFALSYRTLFRTLEEIRVCSNYSPSFKLDTRDLVTSLLTHTHKAAFKYLVSLDDALVKDAFKGYYHEFFNVNIRPFKVEDIVTMEQSDASIDKALEYTKKHSEVDNDIFSYLNLLRHNQ